MLFNNKLKLNNKKASYTLKFGALFGILYLYRFKQRRTLLRIFKIFSEKKT